ncbi:MAG TPA: YbhB/YbcL family Raf kinase inhibitor-like protein [Vicinamibacterales bacterium]|nr:YbhB/YbcL family Raf kinase inhibitor-like protein [Vicinamibacterales bacterium]
MRPLRVVVLMVVLAATAAAQQRGAVPLPPPGVQPPAGQPPTGAQRGGRGRGAVQVMTLTSSAWPDGGQIPAKYTQAGDESSPPLTWSNAPEGVVSYALIVHDVDAAIGSGTDDLLHWMLWNIPATVTALHERAPSAPQLPDGTRQISATGPFYRGPGALASGPAHHYVFELFALDTMIDVPAVGQSPPQTRSAVEAAMAGHVRGKASYVGLFKRQP